jgi:hypothetical protein
MDAAARVSTGTPWPDGAPCERGSVLIISGEDDPRDTIRPRLAAHNADLSKVFILSMVRRIGSNGKPLEIMFTLADVTALEDALRCLPDCKLIIVDPIGSFLGGTVDAHRDNAVRAVLAPVGKLAEKYGAAVLMVAHRRKSAGDVADDLALGSRAFTGIARAVWHLSSDPENKSRKLLLAGKSNLAAAVAGLAFLISGDPPTIQWEREPVNMTADEALAKESGSGRRGPEPKALAAATDWLKNELADLAEHPVDKLKESKPVGMGWRTVERAADKLGVKSHRATFGSGYVWRLPKPGKPSPDLPVNMPATSPGGETTWQPGEQGETPRKTDDSARQVLLPAKLNPLGEQRGNGDQFGIPDAPHVAPMTDDELALYGEPASDSLPDDADDVGLDFPDPGPPTDYGPDGEPIWPDEADQ